MESKKILFLITLCWAFQQPIQAQELDSTGSKELKEVVIQSIPYSTYTSGSKIQQIDSISIFQNQHLTLSDLLLQQSAIYLKEYGNGMVSSISFRGTGASHTAVLWNGININSFTLGQSDFSILPIFANDQVDIQYGSASSLYGSEAIGGTIHLYSQPELKNGFKIKLQQSIGSFGRLFSGFNTSYGKGKWELKTKLYRSSAINNFNFQNSTLPDSPLERQTNAAFLGYGWQQEVYFKLSRSSFFSIKGWYHFNHREIQPLMSALHDEKGFTEQLDKNIRIIADFNHHSSLGNLTAKVGFVNDYLLYNNSSRTSSKRFISAIHYEKSLGQRIFFKAGGDWNHILVQADGYALPHQQNRYDIFGSIKTAILKDWVISLNARQAFVTGYRAPFAPSFGSEWTFLKKRDQQLLLKNLFSYNYRVPTLNDRFWNPGGNPNLRPEKGISTEAGLVYTYKKNKISGELEATTYRMWMKDWIIWLPRASYWSPENKRQVNIFGIELAAKAQVKRDAFLATLSGNYAYTKSINKIGLDEFDRSAGKQLPYTPIHRFNTSANISFHTWQFATNIVFTGKRFFETENRTFLEPYALVNASVGKNFNIAEYLINISLRTDNLTNTSYQNLRLRAMPGRSILTSIRFQFPN